METITAQNLVRVSTLMPRELGFIGCRRRSLLAPTPAAKKASEELILGGLAPVKTTAQGSATRSQRSP